MANILSLLDMIPIGTIVVSHDGRIIRANATAAEVLGYAVSEMAGLPVDALVPEQYRGHHAQLVTAFFRHQTPRQMRSGREFTACRKDGSVFPADISLAPLDLDGEMTVLLSIIDLTDHQQRQRALDRSNRALSFLSGSNRTLLRATEQGALLDNVCHLACGEGGYALAWVARAGMGPGKPVHVVARAGVAADYLDDIQISWDDGAYGGSPVGAALRSGRRVISRFIPTDPSLVPWTDRATRYGFKSLIALPLRVDGDLFGTLNLYATVPDAFDEDETRLLDEVADDLAFGIEMLRTRQARHRAEEKLQTQAHTDFVTGLANRARLTNFLADEFARGGHGAVLFMNLEHFQEINDTHGYLVGDALLKSLGERLLLTLRPGKLLARSGGEDFVLVIPGADADMARDAAERLAASMADPFRIGDQEMSLRARIGMTLYPGDRATPAEVCADAALASRDAPLTPDEAVFYSPRMSAAMNERLEIARRLRAAIANDQLHLHYQPKVDMQTGRLTGAEALVRWQDPVLGQVSPGRFIPIAEERGLMTDLGRWALREAGRQLTAWKRAGLRFPGRMAINISPAQFETPGFVERVTDLLDHSDWDPNSLELEITESVLAADGEGAIAIMERLNALGVAFSIDDFGTGFSSLAYLSRFPVDTLKIDMSFIHNMLKSANDHVIVETVIGLAKNLDLSIVAEGVETEEQAAALLALGCPQAQGYLYCPPVPAGVFASRWL